MSDGGPLERPIEEYLPDLQPAFERHGVVLAYLHGSQARGDAGPLSDQVDFEVYTLREFEDTEPLRRIRRLYLLERIKQGEMGQYPHLLGR